MIALFLTLVLALTLLPVTAAAADDGMNMYRNSEFVEKAQPEISAETKQLISAYQKSQTEENYRNLRAIVIENYNAVLDRKEAKLASLKTETAGKPGGDGIVAEMEEIVQEMYITYWSRINSSMLRFTDSRLLKWRIANAATTDYIPVMGAGDSIYVGRTPVTNAEYAAFVAATGHAAPSNWSGGTYPAGEDKFPVNYVSFADADAYAKWLTEKDGVNTYRLPQESEWELAAGHMPKDADFNCKVNDGRTPVDKYADVTRGAHGAIDFWGNVWEWTSTARSQSASGTILGVKGGSWKSPRTDCRTEHRKEGRDAAKGYDDVGFRVIQVKNGREPAKKLNLATLAAPVVTATPAANSITLSWNPVANAREYQIFEFFADTGLVSMLELTDKTTVTISGLATGSTHGYIVQSISDTEISDNVSAEYSVTATCGQTSGTAQTEQASAAAAPKGSEIRLQIGNTVMTVDGKQTAIDQTGAVPVIRNGRTLLPIRAVVEALGGTVGWDQTTRTATLTLDGQTVELTIGSTEAKLNGGAKTLDVAPVIENSRTLLPIRFVAESFGLTVDWDAQSQTVTVRRSSGARSDAQSGATILYQGQASVRIVTAEGKVIYVDPYAGRGYDLPADLILVTHAHDDHNALDKIEKRNDGSTVVTQAEALKDGKHQTFELGFVKVEAVEAGYNDNHDVKECVGYVLTLTDGKKIYLSGDTSTTQQMPSMRDMQIDYAFFCCDGVFNMGLEEAAKCAETVGAKHNIPYHMTGKTPRIYDRKLAEQFQAPNRLIIDAGQTVNIE